MSLYTVQLVEVSADKAADAKTALTAIRDASRAEAGVVTYNVLQDQKAAHRFVIYQEYKDQAAYEAHTQTAHYKAAQSAYAGDHQKLESLYTLV